MHSAKSIGEKGTECDIAGTPTPLVSVVIPVYNDARRLEICLRALQDQDYPKDRYEVIVVDNGSDEDIDSVIGKFRNFQVRKVEEHRAGSYAARNRGISDARGDILAFTDSDCIPASDWIEKGVGNLLRVPNPGLIAGRVEVFYRNPEKPTAVELYDSVLVLRGKRKVEMHKYAATANLFTLRSVFREVGLFNDTLKSGGDVEWGRRVSSRGRDLVYAHDVCVAHPARYSIDQICRKVVRIEGGAHDYARTYRHSFAVSVMRSLSSFVRRVVVVCLNEKLDLVQKAKVIFVMFSVKYVQLFERVRLALGGESRRS